LGMISNLLQVLSKRPVRWIDQKRFDILLQSRGELAEPRFVEKTQILQYRETNVGFVHVTKIDFLDGCELLRIVGALVNRRQSLSCAQVSGVNAQDLLVDSGRTLRAFLLRLPQTGDTKE